ncbi:hypothetical protein CKK34_2904 [Yarrowia sp. E02]|nr:hypothetical protein CKK34_2904 [Yarrowia sp. E02]
MRSSTDSFFSHSSDTTDTSCNSYYNVASATPLPRQELKQPTESKTIEIIRDPRCRGTFDIGDEICGSIFFTPDRDIKVDRLSIHFCGIQTSSFKATMDDTKASWNFLKQRIATDETLNADKRGYERIQEGDTLKPGHRYALDFSLFVPHELPEVAQRLTGLSLNRRLPPSLGSSLSWEEPALDVPGKVATIIYEIKVNVWDEGARKNYQRIMPVRVIPSYPVVELQHHQNAISSSCELRKKSLMSSKRYGSISAHVPPSVVLKIPQTEIDQGLYAISNNGPHQDNTSPVEIKLEYKPDAGVTHLPEIKLITTRIHSDTFRASKGMSFVPNLDVIEEQRKQFSICTSPSSSPGVLKLTSQQDLLGCKELKEEWTPCAGDEGGYEMLVRVPISIPRKPKFIPSFYSALVSRQYRLEVHITVDRQKIHMFVPVQLATRNYTPWNSRDTPEEELPKYEAQSTNYVDAADSVYFPPAPSFEPSVDHNEDSYPGENKSVY